MPEDVKKEAMDYFVPAYKNFSKAKMNDIVKIDSSLMAMQLMLVARAHGYDTNAIGGGLRKISSPKLLDLILKDTSL